MKRHRTRIDGAPSLVPLADLLSNSVGVVIVIMIFVVLAAAGGKLITRVPWEQPAKAERQQAHQIAATARAQALAESTRTLAECQAAVLEGVGSLGEIEFSQALQHLAAAMDRIQPALEHFQQRFVLTAVPLERPSSSAQ